MENRIKEALEEKGISEEQLSKLTGIQVQSIEHWISQHWQPKRNYVKLMAQVLDVSIAWLEGYEVPMGKYSPRESIQDLTVLFKRLKDDEKLRSLCFDIANLTPNQLLTIESMIREFSRVNLENSEYEN